MSAQIEIAKKAFLLSVLGEDGSVASQPIRIEVFGMANERKYHCQIEIGGELSYEGEVVVNPNDRAIVTIARTPSGIDPAAPSVFYSGVTEKYEKLVASHKGANSTNLPELALA